MKTQLPAAHGAAIDIRSALFDHLRDPATMPMRVFYASAIDRVLTHCARRCRGERRPATARRVEPGDDRARPASLEARTRRIDARRCMPGDRAGVLGLLAAAACGQRAPSCRPARGPRPAIRQPDAGTAPAWLREGAAILLERSCSRPRRVVVDREDRLQAFERLQLPARATLSRASTIKVGQAVGRTVVVSGTSSWRASS